jgi:hypothetical protein
MTMTGLNHSVTLGPSTTCRVEWSARMTASAPTTFELDVGRCQSFTVTRSIPPLLLWTGCQFADMSHPLSCGALLSRCRFVRVPRDVW